jgi:hypothetical protein
MDAPLVSGRVTNRDKRGCLLSRLVIPPVTKRWFRAGVSTGKIFPL